MVHLLLAIIYLAFISLGLPDALLGSAWPTMYQQFQVPLSYAGLLSMVISLGTVVSSLQSDRLTKRFGTGVVTTVSVAMTAVAMWGFSVSSSFWMLVLWGIPYGLGAGSVDASLNNYVALHYESKHMSWLHCMWGVGISVGPYIMSYALTGGMTWNRGYGIVSILQVILTLLLVCSLPMWKKPVEAAAPVDTRLNDEKAEKKLEHALSLKEIFALRGAKEVMITFFCYCALEQTAILWGTSYLVLAGNVAEEQAASFASLFCIGITVGRALSGFLTMKFSDTEMIRMGSAVILLGVVTVLLPFGVAFDLVGLVLIGFGCAPIYPCVIHSTPAHFGAENSQAVIGVQMASAYVGTTLMPPLFGVLARCVSIRLFPMFLLVVLIGMFLMHERLVRMHCPR
ncbi:MAG: MFS transporter [Lachnospiraceae bacterium]|nr:MFS transporter [Lachnospiraceae bacterium]